VDLALEAQPLDKPDSVTRFVQQVRATGPDGLVQIPFKNSYWTHVAQIVRETQVPSVILATLGVSLVDQISQLYRQAGVYLISAPDELEAAAWGMKMVKTPLDERSPPAEHRRHRRQPTPCRTWAPTCPPSRTRALSRRFNAPRCPRQSRTWHAIGFDGLSRWWNQP
jgi:hypothetical protein